MNTPSSTLVRGGVFSFNGSIRRAVLEPAFLRVFGTVQNQDGIVHLKAEHLEPLLTSGVEIA